MDGFNPAVVQKTFATNYHHVTDFNERVLSILRPGGRIVVLASMAGALNGYSSEIVRQFRSVASRSQADDMALEYQRIARDSIGSLKQQGWKEAAYSVSKVRRRRENALIFCILLTSVALAGLHYCLHAGEGKRPAQRWRHRQIHQLLLSWLRQYRHVSDEQSWLGPLLLPYVSPSLLYRTKGKGVKTIDEGAATPVMLAFKDLQGRSGGYFKDEKEQAW